MAKKFNADKTPHERIAKSTSLGRRPKSSSMNKHKKKYALATQCIGLGQGIATVLESVS